MNTTHLSRHLSSISLAAAFFASPGLAQQSKSPVGEVALPHITDPNVIKVDEQYKYPSDLSISICDDLNRATDFINYIEATFYCRQVLERSIHIIDQIVSVDKSPAGFANPDEREKYVESIQSLLFESAELIVTLKKDFPEKKFVVDDGFGKMLTALLFSMAEEANKDWVKTDGPSSQSVLGKSLAGVSEVMKSNLLDVEKPLRQFLPVGKSQPKTQIAIKWSDAVQLSNQGKISAAMADFFPVALPANGPSHAIIAVCGSDTVTAKNWKNRICVVAGADIDSDNNVTMKPAQFLLNTIYVKLDDNNLVKIEQNGTELKFFKNSSGYGQFSVDATAFGNGANAELAVANIYKKITDLELLALLGGNWKRITQEIELQKGFGNRSVSAELVQSLLEPLETGVGLDREYLRKRFNERVPVYLKLPDTSLLKIVQSKGEIEFSRTESGHASIGGKVYVMGVGGGTDIPVNHLYVSITPQEAVAYFGNDWRTIYDKVLKQDNVLPNSVSPVLVKNLLAPNSQ